MAIIVGGCAGGRISMIRWRADQGVAGAQQGAAVDIRNLASFLTCGKMHYRKVAHTVIIAAKFGQKSMLQCNPWPACAKLLGF
jgi:hypothetical protein